MRDDYFNEAFEIVGDPYVLVNIIWERMQMLRKGNRPPVESVEKLSLEDVALREIIDGRITYVLGDIVVLENLGTQGRAGDTRSNPSISPLVDAPCTALAPTRCDSASGNNAPKCAKTWQSAWRNRSTPPFLKDSGFAW